MEQRHIFQKGRIPWNKGLYGEKSHSFNRNFSAERKLRISEGIKRAYDIKGRKSKSNELLRKSPLYFNWRKAVFERDKYKCQRCNSNKDIHPHHIKYFAKFPELRFDMSNGLTLCSECHGKEHGLKFNKYGRHITCLICNIRFRPKSGHLKQECCSKACGYKLRSTRPNSKKGRHYPHLIRKPLKICFVCHKEYRATIHKNRIQKYCSKYCWSNRGENLTGQKSVKLQ